MSKYKILDDLIVQRIALKPCAFTQLQSSKIMDVANDLAIPDYRGHRAGWRVLDRRLQALRKAGRIAFAKGKWSEVTP